MSNQADDIQKNVAGLWSDLLGVPSVLANDDFFSLGGDSILVAVLMMRVEETFDVYLDFGAIHDAPSLALFSEAIAQAMARSAVDETAK